MSTETNTPNRALVLGLAFAAGTGLTLMILALAVGSVEGETANSQTMLVLFVGGLVLLIGGIGGWLAVVQPHRQFDDINVPAPDEHHDDDHHDDHAIVPAEATGDTRDPAH